VASAQETVGVRARLAAVLDDLPENLLAEVQDFAEFLRYKQQVSNETNSRATSDR